MFNFNKKQEKDPQKALDNARDTLNKGFVGGLTKAFMGKDFVDQMNGSMDQAQTALNGMSQTNWLTQNGLEASAEVLSVADTGATVNMNPVVTLKLKITPMAGVPFETMGNTMVSRIAVPRIGDTVKIKYHPADPSQFVVLQ
jgi:hypothetical protein